MAKRQGRTQSELLRWALQAYIVRSEVEELATLGKKLINSRGLKLHDINRLIDQGISSRRTVKN